MPQIAQILVLTFYIFRGEGVRGVLGGGGGGEFSSFFSLAIPGSELVSPSASRYNIYGPVVSAATQKSSYVQKSNQEIQQYTFFHSH